MPRSGKHVKGPDDTPFVRRWPKRLLIGADIFLALVLLVAGLGYGYVRYRIDSIKTGSSVGLSPSDGSNAASSDGLTSENILLIGNETRAGQTKVNFGNAAELTGTLSDIVMILHLDPATDTASIISIPRDTFVPMPAGSPVGPYQKIDAALNDGKLGPNNLIKAITQDFGIPINHYVEVDFDGFLETVDALGGIKLDFPERLHDGTSGLDITHTGCQLLDGNEALALVRSRDLQYDPPGVSASDPSAWPYDPESDLARIVRDQTFIRVLAKTAESEGLTNPVKANAFLGAVLNQLTIDTGLKSQLLKLVAHYHSVNPLESAETTIPVSEVDGTDDGSYIYEDVDVGDVEFPDQPADDQTIEKWDPGALPTPVAPTAVRVSNISGISDLAVTVGTALRSDGFKVTEEGTGTDPGSVSETLVQYHPGQLAEGFSVFQKLSGAVVLQSLASVPSGTVEVQAGSALAVQSSGSAATTSTTSTSSSTTSTTSTPSSTSSTTSTTVSNPDLEKANSANGQLTHYDPRPC